MTPERITVYALDTPARASLQCHVRPGKGAFCALYGWDAAPPPIDAGPPARVEEVFAAAVVRCGTLAFLALPDRIPPRTGWDTGRDGSWLRIPPSLADRVRRRRPPSIFATTSPDHARLMFSGPVSWSQQHQVGFLLRAGRLPVLDRRLIAHVMAARDASITSFGLPDDVIALALPAVDGDYLEIVARDDSTLTTIRSAIAGECERRGVTVESRSGAGGDTGTGGTHEA